MLELDIVWTVHRLFSFRVFFWFVFSPGLFFSSCSGLRPVFLQLQWILASFSPAAVNLASFSPAAVDFGQIFSSSAAVDFGQDFSSPAAVDFGHLFSPPAVDFVVVEAFVVVFVAMRTPVRHGGLVFRPIQRTWH